MKSIHNISTARLRHSIVYLLCISLSLLLQPLVGIGIAATPSGDSPTIETIEAEAAKYSKAMTEIGGIAAMRMTAATDIQNASRIAAANKDGLKFAVSRMVQIAVDDPTFRQGVVSEINKKPGDEGYNNFLQRLSKDPVSVLNIDGALQARRAIQDQLKRDVETLTTAGRKLKAATEAQKRTRVSNQTEEAGYQTVKAGFASDARAISSVLPSVINAGDNPITRILSASAGILAGVVRKRSDSATVGRPPASGLNDSAWPARDAERQYRGCLARAATVLRDCKRICEPGGLQWVCLAACEGISLIESGQCVGAFLSAGGTL